MDDDLIDLHEMQELAANGREQLNHRQFDFVHQLSSMSDRYFRERYRVSKESFFLLCDELSMESKTRGNFIDPRIDVLCFLRYLCTGSFMQVSGDLVKISKASSCRAVHRIMKLVASLSEKYITFPDHTTSSQQEFFQLYGFPYVVGAIDCTHVQIQSTGGPIAEVF